MNCFFIKCLFALTIFQNIHCSNLQSPTKKPSTHNPYAPLPLTHTQKVLQTLVQLGIQATSVIVPAPNVQFSPTTDSLQFLTRHRKNQLWQICSTFNLSYTHSLPREEKLKALKNLLQTMSYEEINAFNEQGQTLAHRLAPLGDKELYKVLIDHGLNIMQLSHEKNNYEGSTAAHNLAGIYKKSLQNSKNVNSAKRYRQCLQIIAQQHPEILNVQAKNGLTPKDILGDHVYLQMLEKSFIEKDQES